MAGAWPAGAGRRHAGRRGTGWNHHGAGVRGRRKIAGFTVDEVIDLLSVGGETLERRQALPGIDPALVQAVGRRSGQLFVVLDTDALLTPFLLP